MLEIPIWLLFVLVLSIFLLFVFNMELTYRISKVKYDQVQIGLIISNSFENITRDVHEIDKDIENIYGKVEKLSKTSH